MSTATDFLVRPALGQTPTISRNKKKHLIPSLPQFSRSLTPVALSFILSTVIFVRFLPAVPILLQICRPTCCHNLLTQETLCGHFRPVKIVFLKNFLQVVKV